MSKSRVTRKWVKDNFYCCSVGYCDLQNLLHYQSASYYTCGIYGWNMDVYTFGDYAITTGYRGMIDNVPGDYHSLIREYEEKARELLKAQWEKPGDVLEAEVNKLLKEFLQKVFDTEDSNRFYIF
jgi:hypothetical protein